MRDDARHIESDDESPDGDERPEQTIAREDERQSNHEQDHRDQQDSPVHRNRPLPWSCWSAMRAFQYCIYEGAALAFSRTRAPPFAAPPLPVGARAGGEGAYQATGLAMRACDSLASCSIRSLKRRR